MPPKVQASQFRLDKEDLRAALQVHDPNSLQLHDLRKVLDWRGKSPEIKKQKVMRAARLLELKLLPMAPLLSIEAACRRGRNRDADRVVQWGKTLDLLWSLIRAEEKRRRDLRTEMETLTTPPTTASQPNGQHGTLRMDAGSRPAAGTTRRHSSTAPSPETSESRRKKKERKRDRAFGLSVDRRGQRMLPLSYPLDEGDE